jgi:hypothetical protein
VAGLRHTAGGGVIKNRPMNQQGRRGGRDEGRLTRTILSDAAILDGKIITIANILLSFMTTSSSNIQWTRSTDPIHQSKTLTKYISYIKCAIDKTVGIYSTWVCLIPLSGIHCIKLVRNNFHF